MTLAADVAAAAERPAYLLRYFSATLFTLRELI
jgi:hypothetical protein